MNALRNNARLIGHLGEDPKVTQLESGRMLANFNLATNEVYRDKHGVMQSETNWHRIVAWGKQAELVKSYLKKGSEVAIDGKLNNRSYEDKNGEKHYVTEIVVNGLLLMDRKGKS